MIVGVIVQVVPNVYGVLILGRLITYVSKPLFRPLEHPLKRCQRSWIWMRLHRIEPLCG